MKYHNLAQVLLINWKKLCIKMTNLEDCSVCTWPQTPMTPSQCYELQRHRLRQDSAVYLLRCMSRKPHPAELDLYQDRAFKCSKHQPCKINWLCSYTIWKYLYLHRNQGCTLCYRWQSQTLQGHCHTEAAPLQVPHPVLCSWPLVYPGWSAQDEAGTQNPLTVW